jgi:hypothetical protein
MILIFFIKNSCTRFPIFQWKRKLEMKKENSFLLVNRPLVFQKLDPYDKNQYIYIYIAGVINLFFYYKSNIKFFIVNNIAFSYIILI